MLTSHTRLLAFCVATALSMACLTASLVAQDSTVTKECPLPITTTSASTDGAGAGTDAKSPEQPPDNQAVLHNGKVLCLPRSAAEAHVRHGDQPMGPCDKSGNQK